jgi:DNA polymerase-4
MVKPDACTIIRPESFREQIWPLPAGDLLYVGRATEAKLKSKYIRTIGDLALTDPETLKLWFGKVGLVLHEFANGADKSEVAPIEYETPVKGIGNSQTCPRDLVNDTDVKIMLYALSESVGARLMEQGFYCKTIEWSFVTSDMNEHGSRQCKLEVPTNISGELADAAYSLFKSNWTWRKTFRKIGVRASDLVGMDTPRQLSIWENPEQTAKREELERTVNTLRYRYGNKAVQRAIMLTAPELARLDIKRDNTIHPVGVFSGGVSANWGYHRG